MATTISPDKKLQTLILERVLLQKINDFRFERRYESMAAALRFLIIRGALAEGVLEVQSDVSVEPGGNGPWEGKLDGEGRFLGWEPEFVDRIYVKRLSFNDGVSPAPADVPIRRKRVKAAGQD